MSYHGRFAPSPSGPLHFGSLVAAVASWLDARAAGGRWTVRIEDVDAPRTVPGAEAAILAALAACGLEWDGAVTRQSERLDRYEAALEALAARGLVYDCRCSRREIADSGVAGIEGIVYPGTCRALRLPPDASHAVRLSVPAGRVAFDDRTQGHLEQDVAAEVGDFVLRRRDAQYAYQLAVVVDDAQQGITDVVRGADLLASTPRQVVLQRALGLPTPRYLHVPMATDGAGAKLSKQNLATGLDPARAREDLRSALAFLGQPESAGATPQAMLAAASTGWDTRRIPRRASLPAPPGS